MDIETTGLYPGGDRIVELAVVRIEPNEAPRLVLDTLVNPKRRVAATEIHGITDADVADAPPFEEIAGNVDGPGQVASSPPTTSISTPSSFRKTVRVGVSHSR